jgi:nicotinate-nucleotide adenylyltransferase
MKIGILGGTFDPIHIGHLLMAEQALCWYDLDQVWFIPASTPPHKQGKSITAVHHRVEMVRRAVRHHPHFLVDTRECERSGTSYTIDTLRELQADYPNVTFFLIMGADTVKDLPNWYKIEEILQITKIIAIQRPGVNLDHLPSYMAERIVWVQDGIEIRISSTFIRTHVKRGKMLHYAVPEAVYQYIKEYSLYEC